MVIIPSGLPPFFLPFGGEALSEHPEVTGLNLLDGNSGLMSGGDALAAGLGHTRRPNPEAPQGRFVGGSFGGLPVRNSGPVPDEETILEWAREVQRLFRQRNPEQFLSNRAIAYWARYTFAPYTAEYKEVVAVLLS